MRWIFFSLLAANVAFFCWTWIETSRQDRLAAMNTVSSDRKMPGKQLQLLSELTDEQRATLSIAAARPLEVTAQVSQAELAPVNNDLSSENNQNKNRENNKVTEGENRTRDEENSTPERTALKGDDGKELCVMIGPFTDVGKDGNVIESGQVKERLKALGLSAEVKNIDIEDAPDYWVIVSPAENKKAALQTLHELQAKNIESYLIPQGDMANAISLGVYGQEANAAKQKEEMSLLGYPIEMRTKTHFLKEQWLVLSGDSAARLGDEIWLGIQEDFPDLEKRPGYCTTETTEAAVEKGAESTTVKKIDLDAEKNTEKGVEGVAQ